MMLSNYLKFAWRNLLKNKWVNLLNLFGLAVGLSIAFILMMIIRYDTSFDRWEPDYQNTYRLYSYTGQDDINSGVTTGLPAAIKSRVTGVKEVSHILLSMGTVIFRTDIGNRSRSFAERKGVVYVDPSYFSMFPHQWLAGDRRSSLTSPGQVVLSEKAAARFFPNKASSSIIGQTIQVGDSLTAKVAGIVAAPRAPSDFDYEIFLSLASAKTNTQLKATYDWENWGHIMYSSICLVRLTPGSSVSRVEQQLAKLTMEKDPPLAGIDTTVPKLLPLAENHFAVDVNGTIRKSTLVNLGLVGLFILILAIINYVNITTAQASLRLKEISVRKSFGGNNRQIRMQMLFETFLLTLLACLLATLLIPLLTQGFAGFIPDDFHFLEMLDLKSVLWMCLLMIVVSTAAGFYPAIVLARFNPVNVVQQQTGSPRNKGAGRRVLIVFQFVVAQLLVIMVLTINRQIHYSLNKDLGYKNIQGIASFYVPVDSKINEGSKDQLASRLMEIPGIKRVSLSSSPPTSSSQNITVVSTVGKNLKSNFKVWALSGDTNYVHLFGIPLLAGSNLSGNNNDGTPALGEALVNQTLIRQLGYQQPEDAINKTINFNEKNVLIKGVMQDFNTGSTKSTMHPVVYVREVQRASLVSFSMAGGPQKWQHTLNQVKKAYLEAYPDHNFNYSFLDKSIAKLYEQDIAIGKVLSWSSALGILISCMGLFGLISFVANQRRKEIGIRKVLGASSTEIIQMLNSKMLWLVMMAVLIAIPLGWGLSSLWLNRFAYRANIGVLGIIGSAIGLVLIALVVLTLKSFFAARTNPVDSIRSE